MESKVKPLYCRYCGNPLDLQTNECPNCGRKSHSFKIGIVLVIVLCLALLAAGIYFGIKLLPAEQPAELSAEEIYQLASPATVEIRVETEYGTATGTGFFDSTDGTIITNFHVLEDATSGSVYLSNGERYDILKLVGFDRYLDIAIIQIDYQPSNILQVRTDLLQTGETVYALGSSVGLSDSFSQGIISANQREIGGQIFIQTTAPISHGNSGGPLIDKYGKVVGITTAGIETGQNLNLAVPISAINQIDRHLPVNFVGNTSIREEIVFARTGLSYWEWAENPKVICNTENQTYHYGDGRVCFSVWNIWKKTPISDPLPEPYTIMDMKVAIENGYNPCDLYKYE